MRVDGLTRIEPRIFLLQEPGGDQSVVVLLPLFLILELLNQNVVPLLLLPLLTASLSTERQQKVKTNNTLITK